MPVEIVLTETDLALLNKLCEIEGCNQSEMVARMLQFWVTNI